MDCKCYTLFLLCFYFTGIFGNIGSYVTSPATRGGLETVQNGCKGPACLGPCEVPTSQAGVSTTVQRGDTLTVNWPRNNHAGGFIRFAWAPFTESDTMSSFDNNAQVYKCFEIGCGAADPSNPNGGDLGKPDGSYLPCGTTLQVPGYLTDGQWTLQWAWYGGSFVAGDYYACMDFNVLSGEASAQEGPVFEGGDYGNPTNPDVCKFFNTDELHVCVDEPCLSGIPYPGEHIGAPAAISISTPSGGSSSDTENTKCQKNSDCKSGVCESSGVCYKKPFELGSGGKAAIVFAVFVLVVVLAVVAFFIINKKEVPYMVPFKGHM